MPVPAAGEFVRIGASIGVVLLLLALGLEFSITEFTQSLRHHVPSAAVDLVLNAAPGAVAGWLLGLDGVGILAIAGVTYFSSREDLVRSIVQPLIDDGEAFIAQQESLAEVRSRELLAGYFDFHYRHREEIVLVLTELTTLADLGLIDMVLAWRERLARLLYGTELTLAQATRAVVALGGLQDCTIQFPDVPADERAGRPSTRPTRR